MPFTRQRLRLTPTSQLQVRLTPVQRDLLLASAVTPKDLGHLLHRAPVRQGKLMVRMGRAELDALIAAAAKSRPADQKSERELDALLRYLESLGERFMVPDDADSE